MRVYIGKSRKKRDKTVGEAKIGDPKKKNKQTKKEYIKLAERMNYTRDKRAWSLREVTTGLLPRFNHGKYPASNYWS